VHSLLSASHTVPVAALFAVMTATPFAGTHAYSAHWVGGGGTICTPPQTPAAEQESFSVHGLPSSQEVPALASTCFTPVVASQLSTVQGLPSLVATGVPVQEPELLHASAVVHALLSLQAVLTGSFVCVTVLVDGSHVSVVQGLLSSMPGQ
jgi:hypothetical protein